MGRTKIKLVFKSSSYFLIKSLTGKPKYGPTPDRLTSVKFLRLSFIKRVELCTSILGFKRREYGAQCGGESDL